ncbi:MAG: transglutaminase-like domain-containing protein [Candidatus Omnitrophota bacterium]|jgi:hypothetical protein
MRKTIEFKLAEPTGIASDLLFALPFDTPEQTVRSVAVSGCAASAELSAANSGQRVLVLSVAAGGKPSVRVTFDSTPSSFPDWIFVPTGGAHETPSPDLIDLVGQLAPKSLPTPERVERIVRHVEERFTYGMREIGLGDDALAMPALSCDVHLGTCVDTHSYAVAAMRAGGIDAAYVSGVFFPEGEITATPGHCWLVVRAQGAPHHWDISHFLKYRLGRVVPVLNPKPGFRQALSCGRDVSFEGPQGPVTLSRVSGFNLLSGDRRSEPLLTIARAGE